MLGRWARENDTCGIDQFLHLGYHTYVTLLGYSSQFLSQKIAVSVFRFSINAGSSLESNLLAR